MNNISDLGGKGLPSAATLLKASGAAAIVAVVVLVAAILPAEYGVDPTGIGARLGLLGMSSGGQESEESQSAAAQTPTQDVIEPLVPAAPVSELDAVWKRADPYRSDEMSLTLKPNEGAEIKAMMQPGDRFVFSWVAEGGVVNFDMHGEALNAGKDEFTSYWKGRNEGSGHGAFTAPFAGTHGWYWRNRGAAPVTIRVQTSGYYEKLFKP